MAIRVAINHKTVYQYDRFVSLSPHIFRLRPAVHSRTHIEAYSFKIFPAEHFITGNRIHLETIRPAWYFLKNKRTGIEVEAIANML
jgi:hypothetical protein